MSNDGQRMVDPLGAGPTPGGPAPLAPNPGVRNGVATAGLVCGIIGVLFAWMPFLVVAGFVLAVLALVFGIQGRRRANDTGTAGGRATAAIVLGAVGLALSVIGTILSIVVYREVARFIDPADHRVDGVECAVVEGVARVEGTLTNLDRETSGFSLFVKVRAEEGSRQRIRTYEIEGLPPGDSVDWTVRLPIADSARTCTAAVDVYGPFPFGVEIDEP